MSGETDFDLCIVGSGAGAGPVALRAAEAGLDVLVLEKGPWLKEGDFKKDEVAIVRRHGLSPHKDDEPHVVEDEKKKGQVRLRPTNRSGWDFWNGNVVGGASNVMSGFFHRLKPEDFRQLSEFGPIAGANIADWPISYQDLEPYYAMVEHEVGVSGKVTKHQAHDRRSTRDFPYAPTAEHPVATWIDEACARLGQTSFPIPRAILPRATKDRGGCEYAGYCGGYGCATGAKGSSRAALLSRALKTGKLQIRADAMVHRLESDARGKVTHAHFLSPDGTPHVVSAKVFVVACQAIESARLLLASTGPRHQQGLANSSGQVGQNLLFSAAGSGGGVLRYADHSAERARLLALRIPFINRATQDHYFLAEDKSATSSGASVGLGDVQRRRKGGTIDFLFRHNNPIHRAFGLMHEDGGHVWGSKLQAHLERSFSGGREIEFETFVDWLPHDNCRVTLDDKVRDIWGNLVARVRPEIHPHNKVITEILVERGRQILAELGCQKIHTRATGGPATNLLAGTCRFGHDAKTSVLDADCRAHDVENLFVTDGSFMPTGGSVPYTWTIYANAFRVAEKIVAQL